MNDGLRPVEGLLHAPFIEDAALHELEAAIGKAGQEAAAAVHEIVEHAHLVPDGEEMGHQYRSDVPRTTGNEKPHGTVVLSRGVERRSPARVIAKPAELYTMASACRSAVEGLQTRRPEVADRGWMWPAPEGRYYRRAHEGGSQGDEVPRDGADHFTVYRKWAHPVCEHEWTCPVAIGFAELVRSRLDHDGARPARAKRAP
jgi:hypothetical protein